MSEALGFTDDLMFQNVMRDPEICRMFLNEVLPHLDIQDITVRTQERIAFNQEEKVSILDVLITDSRGRRYITMWKCRSRIKQTWINEPGNTCSR